MLQGSDFFCTKVPGFKIQLTGPHLLSLLCQDQLVDAVKGGDIQGSTNKGESARLHIVLQKASLNLPQMRGKAAGLFLFLPAPKD